MVRRLLGNLVGGFEGTEAHRVEFSKTMEEWQALEDEMFKGAFLAEQDKEGVSPK